MRSWILGTFEVPYHIPYIRIKAATISVSQMRESGKRARECQINVRGYTDRYSANRIRCYQRISCPSRCQTTRPLAPWTQPSFQHVRPKVARVLIESDREQSFDVALVMSSRNMDDQSLGAGFEAGTTDTEDFR